MIRVKRPVNPPSKLRDAEKNRLRPARDAYKAGTLQATSITGYQVARSELSAAQHGKCAYCEWRPPGDQFQPVEHYRPKDHYWWLAWHWENLLFACQYCNSIHKGTQFPLRDESTRLVPEERPPGAEEPWVIDPAGELDPRDHIQFRRVAGRWRPVPKRQSDYGERTIEVLGLDQPPILDEYQRFFRQCLADAVDNMNRALSEGSSDDVKHFWSQLVAHASPQDEFAGFALDVIEQEFDVAALATKYGLAVPTL